MEQNETDSARFSALCDVLLEGFHVAAQPLTMLQAALSTDCTALLPEADLRELTQTCSREADRLTRTFRSLKRLVQSYRYPPKLTNVDLSEVLKKRVPGSASNGEGQAIAIRVEVSPELPPVIADRDATGDMLQTLVEVIAAYCEPGDAVAVHGEEADGAVRLTIASGSSFPNRVPGEFKVALPLASARMELQNGKASLRTSPVVVELTFAIAMSTE
jgi:nitrogen-specific signal transduction histidine kinase